MPYKIKVDERQSVVSVSLYGNTSFEERVAMLDEKLFVLEHYDIRHALCDFSGIVETSDGLDDLYFAELVARHKAKAHHRSTVILGEVFPETLAALAFMEKIEAPIEVYQRRGPVVLMPFERILEKHLHMERALKFRDPADRQPGFYDVYDAPMDETVYIETAGHQTYADRIDIFERALFLAMKKGYRKLLWDGSGANGTNNELDDLYFVEFMQCYRDFIKDFKVSILHAPNPVTTKIVAGGLKHLGAKVETFELNGRLGSLVKPRI